MKLKYISVGNDSSIWAAGKIDGTVYRLYGDAGYVGWVPDKIGKADVIAAVDWGNAWCVNKDHEIWRLQNAESLDTGGTWTKIPTYSGNADALTISVGTDGTVWYAAMDGTICHLTGSDGNMSWVPDKIGKAVSLAAGDRGNLWCVNKDHEIWYLDKTDGGTWDQLPTHSGKADALTIAYGYDGSFYVQTDGKLIQTVPPGVGVDLGLWREITRPGSVTVIAVEPKGGVWCLADDGQAWRKADGNWEQFVEIIPIDWTYTVKSGDNLLAIVRKEFNLKDPQNTTEINRLVDLIVAQNPTITRDRINADNVLKLAT